MKEMDYQTTAADIRRRDPRHAVRRMLLVLGSGWGPVVEQLMQKEGQAQYADLPGFPVSTVEGHAGQLVWGDFAGVPAYCMQGRFHYYEGYSMQEITFPLRVFASLGIKGVLLTNAAGGLNPGFSVGDLMLIRDHINFMGINPLIGPNQDAFGPRFPDMTRAYDPPMQTSLEACAKEAGINLQAGTYLAVSGPSFETPAEIAAFARLGADAVGMSTVPECIVARHCGMRVAGISCITNLAAHVAGDPLSHEDVAAAARLSIDNVISLLRVACPKLNAHL